MAELPFPSPSLSTSAAPAVGLFLIGAPKCGTTAMASYLNQHPRLFVPSIKEPHHFCIDSPKLRRFPDRAGYEALYARLPNGTIGVDASVWYLNSRVAAREIAAYNPEARILAMVRAPRTMLPSLHNQMIYSWREDVADFAEAWALRHARRRGERIPRHALEPRHLIYDEVCLYHADLARYRDVFPDERIMVLRYEDFAADPKAATRRVLAFIGLEPDFPLETPVVNAAKRYRYPRLATFLRRPPWPLSVAKDAVKRIPVVRATAPMRPVYSLLSAPAKRAAPPEDVLADIDATYAADQAALSAWIERMR